MFDNNKLRPTFGISFGLPNQGGGGYPLNPLNYNPAVNPYGSSVGGGGINLGLISVNPLLSVQVTKDDYGEKVIKPFVNLHVTPNDFLVHKVEDFLTYKKHLIFNKPYYHHHYHHPHAHHQPYPRPPLHYNPHPQPAFGPPYYESPEIVGPPIHDHYPEPNPHYDYAPNFAGDYEGGYDDNFYGRNTNHTYFSSRKGKAITSQNPIKFPSSRQRRYTEKVIRFKFF